jgi:zinc transporter ZupT
MLALALAAAAVVPRLMGGLSVLRRNDRLHLAMGFAGGAMIGVALFETGPEAFDLAPGGWLWVAAVAALGVVVFAGLERRVFHHVHVEDTICNPRAAEIGAGGITTHAFLDGLAIGSAFQVSSQLGLLVSSAVLLHAFADGLNTVTILLRHGHRHRTAKLWLAADAGAPIAGAAVGLLTPLPDPLIAALLAFFAGMFIYFGAGSLLPQAHRAGRNRVLVLVAAAAGIVLAFAAANLG